jgi:hypothetical protein
MSHSSMQHFLVYIPFEECYGHVIHLGAYVSKVRYSIDGIQYETFIENEDIVFLDSANIGIEEEEI